MKINLLKAPKAIINFIINLKSNYWFIPAVMTLLGVIASIVMVELDQLTSVSWLRELKFITLNQPDGARALLSTIAGSMITVAGVTFSMTLLSVAHASSQIGPRILSGFMNDRGNQFTLGTFVSTFVYCVLVLRTVHSKIEASGGVDKTEAFIPHLAIFLAIILALLSVSMLIYFVHHVPQTISMTNAVNRVGEQLIEKINKAFPKSENKSNEYAKIPEEFEKNKREVIINKNGFFKFADIDSLTELANEHDTFIKLHCSPGEFIFPGTTIASYLFKETNLDDEISSKFFFGKQRSIIQDFYFPADLLIEVAARALSPGVNDPYTATECINQLCSALITASQRLPAEVYKYSEGDVLRVSIIPAKKIEFLNHFCDKIRFYCKEDLITTVHLIESLSKAIKIIDDPEIQKALISHIKHTYTDYKKSNSSTRDLSLVEDKYKDAIA